MRGLRKVVVALATITLASMQFGGASATMVGSKLSRPSSSALVLVGSKDKDKDKNNNAANNGDRDRKIGPNSCPKGLVWNSHSKRCDPMGIGSCPKGKVWDRGSKACRSPGFACPYLFAWNEDEKVWDNYRKVITKARGRESQLTDVVVLDKPAYRFRLREMEQEISFIDAVRLALTLADGREVNLRPKRADLASADGAYKKLYPGQRVDIRFALPKDIAETDVKHAELHVTGYYVVIEGSPSN